MTKYIAFLLFLISFSSVAQDKKCSEFRTGEFIYPSNENKVSIRKESVQESYNDGKLEATWKVSWLNECKYELVCEKVLMEDSPFQIGDKIVATILNTDSKCYTFSLIVYNSENPKGFEIPNGTMCKK